MTARSPIRARRGLLVVGAAAALAAAFFTGGTALAAIPSADTTGLTSLNSGGANRDTTGVSDVATSWDVSADGRYVVYTTAAHDAIPNLGVNAHSQVYRRDLVTNTVQLVSARTDGNPANDGDSSNAAISADGRYITFESNASHLTPEVPAPGVDEVYERDMGTQGFGPAPAVTILVSQIAGVAFTDGAQQPSISDDGSRISFTAPLFEGAGSPSQVVLWDASSPALVTLVSGADGTTTEGNSSSDESSISGDGTTVAFASLSSNLVALPAPDGRKQIYQRTVASKATTMVSVRLDHNAGGDLDSLLPSSNVDGSVVAFESLADNLTANTVSATDVQVYASSGLPRSVELVSVSLNGTWGDDDAHAPSVSSDGTRVAFATGADDLTQGTTIPHGDSQVFVRDRATGSTLLASAKAGDPSTAGGPIPFTALGAAISQDGRYVAFSSDETDLTPTPTNDQIQAYLRALPVMASTPTPTPSNGGSDDGNGDGASGHGHDGLASTGLDGVVLAGAGALALAPTAAASGLLIARRRRS